MDNKGKYKQGKLPISVIVLTHNEEESIEACLQSVADWAGEILVVDSGSTDGTLEIVRRFTDSVYSHPFADYSSQRNWATANLPVANDWVFHLDADERVSCDLARSLEEYFLDPPPDRVSGLLLVRRTIFMGRWIKHGGHYPSYHLRLFRRLLGHCETRLYDQHFVVDGGVETIDGDLLDYVTSDLNSWTERHLRWALAEARQACEAEKSPGGEVHPRFAGSPIERKRWLRQNLYYQAPLFLRSFLYFIYRFIFRLGFLDGREGLVFHFLQGFWFRFYIDSLIFEAKGTRERKASSRV